MSSQITSVMMVLYNRLSLTQRMMESFLKTTHSPYRLILVDNGSIDGTVEWMQHFKPEHADCQGVVKHFFPENYGVAIGRNQGLFLANRFSDPYLATIDNDVEMPDNWLRQCLDIMQVNPKYTIGVNFEDTPNFLHKLTKNGKTFNYKAKGNLGTACMVFDRELHNKIGFFTTDYAKYGEEDANWGFRSRMAGYNLGYLIEPGKHFGVAELDTGEYRQFKDDCRKKNVAQFNKDCHDYMQGRKSIYHDYTPPAIKSE
jgi:GT2 family glycosyltransferase